MRSSTGLAAPPRRPSHPIVAGRIAAVALPLLATAAALGPVAAASVQDTRDALARVAPELLREVAPGASRFDAPSGDPPVVRAFAAGAGGTGERLAGYVFVTSDWPPEETGYNGPVEALVGIDVEGTLTGVRVLDYYESLRATEGDFLRRPGVQEQFRGKPLTDAFRVRRDVDNVTGATITVGALARGVRASARRVAGVHLRARRLDPATARDAAALALLTWPEVVAGGLADRIEVVEDGVARLEVHLMPLAGDDVGRTLLGEGDFDRARAELGEPAANDGLWLVGVDGPLEALFRATALSVARGGDTVRVGATDVALADAPRSGIVGGHLRRAGLVRVPGGLDADRPFEWVLDFGGGMGPYVARHAGRAAGRVTAASAPVEGAAAPVRNEAGVADSTRRSDGPEAGDERPTAGGAAPGVGGAEPGAGDAPLGARGAAPVPEATGPPRRPPEPSLSFANAEEDVPVLIRALERTDWLRFAGVAAVLVLATAAFAAKGRPRLRAAALAAALLYLGFGGGGFLSVSHAVAGLTVGPGVFLEDLSLLLLVLFTAFTTLFWGRVFCGFLCPFGALQDALERIVPRSVRRELPGPVHRRAWWIKYALLALVVLPAAVGSHATLYHYVEPFGTVFFLSPSVGLWAVALVLLAASAVVPRFYCRYACPLGAALALGSMLAPFRIRRVEQCGVCAVCERHCPTGAIRLDAVDFRECVRCNACERKLLERAGACRHDARAVRARLVPLELGRPGTSGEG